MCVGRKPHPFGNERHTICCRLTPIVWRKNIVKGKDRPSQLIPKMHLDIRISFGIMLRMCKHIFYTGKSIVMNSGFCVTNGIVTLAVKGVAIITSKEVGNQLVPEVIKWALRLNQYRLVQGCYYTPLYLPDPEMDIESHLSCMATWYIL